MYAFLFIIIIFLLPCDLFSKSNESHGYAVNSPKILLVHRIAESANTEKILRGSTVYKINLLKHLVANRFNVSMLIIDDHQLYQDLLNKGFSVVEYLSEKKGDEKLFEAFLYDFCKKERVAIIHCHENKDVNLAKKLNIRTPVKVVVTLHLENQNNINSFKGVDGVLCVSEKAAQTLTQDNEKQHLGIKNITFLPPFFDDDRFLHFRPTRSATDFFKQKFGIQLKKLPLVTMVANFYPTFKDHTTVLKAACELIYKDHLRLQIAFAGVGKRMKEIQALAQELDLNEYVYFLGHTDLIPELYYHSDVAVLSSPNEAFGIALLEAALMKKPLIGTKGTGMESVVKHDKTGLLFTAFDEHELAGCIKKLISDSVYAKFLGNNAYAFVQENYLTKVTINSLAVFYQKVVEG